MTREEAINNLKFLKGIVLDYNTEQSIDMAIKALEQEPKWIPVSERLPKCDEDVLVTTKCKIVTIGYIHPEDKVWVTNTADEFERVTAWMPLPEPYKESEGR